jgi:hypothetical protein
MSFKRDMDVNLCTEQWQRTILKYMEQLEPFPSTTNSV